MLVGAIPERVRWTVANMAVRPGDRLLEIGCGRGAAVSLVCDRLRSGQITAIDRSLTMVKFAEQRNAEHVAAGRAVFQTTALDAADLPARKFDKVFAVNVNLFWVRSSASDLEIVRRLLKPSGAMFLTYEPPTPGRAEAIAGRIAGFLTEQRFEVTTTYGTTHRSALVSLVAKPVPGR
ncbi:MAG: class I SAM-dependent methyltransferase [Hamadaea sp.]|uniref:SAM-dependent methyltransferase n=1 Tax=Hamadaea sp. TaxID=2024425 RepID=UPI0017B76E7C|nr:class I SAM-dependent methyltransferase [Hamadaea sp.]NUR71431.1 class I SAM-dependent methyltransferase [Hamadaea sp.]NUT23741.1 class I SAM-dependent methyltransferase [Hamadaea sp.]